MQSDGAGPDDPRGVRRLTFDGEVAVRRSGTHGFRVHIFDASPEGCKIEFVERPAVGERIWVKFDGMDALEATVCWVEGHIGGVHFIRHCMRRSFGASQRLRGASHRPGARPDSVFGWRLPTEAFIHGPDSSSKRPARMTPYDIGAILLWFLSGIVGA